LVTQRSGVAATLGCGPQRRWRCFRFQTRTQVRRWRANLGLKERGRDYAGFEWQGGYADFSVSQSMLPEVKEYIAGQEEHHRKIGFSGRIARVVAQARD